MNDDVEGIRPTGGAVSEDDLIARTREYVTRVVSPRARELDAEQDPEASFSWEFMEQADAYGLRTLRLDPANGGSGLGFKAVMHMVREVAKGDAGVAAQLAQVNHLSRLVEVAGTDAQVREYLLPAFVDDPRFVLAIGSTEPDVGSDAQFTPPGKVQYRTTATRRDGDWVLNGKKQFIHNGNRASLYLIMAQTDPDENLTRGSECFLVKGDNPGIRGGVVHDKMGERLANHAEILLENCVVPDDSILRYQGADEERGSALLFNANPGRAVLAGATVIGVAEAAFELTWQWVHRRRQGGAQLIEHSSVQETVARMRMQLDAALAYLDKAADEMELAVIGARASRPVDRTMALLPKVFAAEAAWEIVGLALELHAGRGYMRDAGVEKLVRDAASWKHSEGANKTLLLRAVRIMRDAA